MADVKVKDLPNATTYSLDDNFIKDKFDGSITQKSTIQNIWKELGFPLSANFTLSAAELATLFTVPKDIIPAPGAGKAIEFISGSAELTFGGIAYDIGQLTIKTETAIQHQAASANTLLLNVVSVFQRMLGITGTVGNTLLVANKKLQVTLPANPTVGNGTVKGYILYRIITL